MSYGPEADTAVVTNASQSVIIQPRDPRNNALRMSTYNDNKKDQHAC